MTPAQFEHIVTVIPEAVIITDLGGVIRFANPAAHHLFGKRDGELAGTLTPFTPKDGEASEIEVRQGNERRFADIRVVGCTWNGEPALLATIRDITEQKRAVDHQRQALKMEALGALAGAIAHDFNNLLLIMLIYAEMIRAECAKDDPRLPDIMEVVRAVERAQGLTRELLAFARRQPAQPTAIRLDAVVTGLDPSLRRALPASIEIVTQFAEQSWPVRADQSQIEQVIMNLAINAMEAMPDGGRFVLDIQNRRLPKESGELLGDYVALRAIDTGGGIEPSHLDRIFEPFFTTRERGRGTGLGLATCYGIVAQAGGRIAVESELGKGTTFTILLPRTHDEITETRSDAEDVGQNDGLETILVVEDDAAVMRATTNILRTNGYTVMTAANGDEACRVLQDQSHSINLVLSDIVMPQLSGLELEKIVADRWPQLPLVLMTGYSEQPVVQQHDGIRIENRPALLKPFRASALLRIVRNTLDSGKSDSGKPAGATTPSPSVAPP